MVTVAPFGTCPLGEVSALTLSNDSGMSVTLLTYGATIQSLIVPDKHGNPTDVVLGFDTIEGYLNTTTYAGATIGRCANRTEGATFTHNGMVYPLTPNENGNHHHGGLQGFDKVLWDVSHSDNHVSFHYTSPHMEEGYPGTLEVVVTYTLTQTHTLAIEFQANCDQDTLCSLTAHSYFNLSGHSSGTIGTQSLALWAPSYTPTKEGNIPTGEVIDVAGTPFDLSTATLLSSLISHPALSSSKGLDHNFMRSSSKFTPVAQLYSPETGISMALTTSLPAIQVYTAGFFPRQDGKNKVVYDQWHGVALEPQFPPDAVHHHHFPSPLLSKENQYLHHVTYIFSIK